jgi:hypothetical protein
MAVGLHALAGCAGSGEVVPMDIRAAVPTETTVKRPAGLRVAVVALEDRRANKNAIGLRTHIGGGETYFDIYGGEPGDVVAQVLADYLRQKGWQAWMAKPGITVPGDSADVTLSGQILDVSTRAQSRFGSTVITATVRLAIEAKNAADGSVLNLSTMASNSDTVFWFKEQDAQELLNSVLQGSLDKLAGTTRIEGRSLRLN